MKYIIWYNNACLYHYGIFDSVEDIETYLGQRVQVWERINKRQGKKGTGDLMAVGQITKPTRDIDGGGYIAVPIDMRTPGKTIDEEPPVSKYSFPFQGWR